MRSTFTFLLLFVSLYFFGQAGAPVPNFGTNGIITTPINSSYDEIRSMAVQADGKLVAAGRSNFNSTTSFAVTRYNTDGSLDNSFNGTGKLTMNFGVGTGDIGNAVAIQNDGKIVVAGYSVTSGGNYDFAVARFTTTGALDNSFNGNGKVTTDFGALDVSYAMAIQGDGKIVVAGYTVSGGYALVRYNTDGSLDNNFGVSGKLTTAVSGSNDKCFAVAIQADGKIVAAGSSNNIPNTDFSLIRYNTNGSLDNSFGINGKLMTPIVSGNDGIRSMALQADGKIVVAGYANNGSNNDFAVARYNTDGTLDNGFSTSGKQITDFGTGSEDGYGVEVQSDGKIIVSGTNGVNFLLARYTSAGILDKSFNSNGKLILDLGRTSNLWAMKLSGYRIYTGGYAFVNSSPQFTVAALQNDATPLNNIVLPLSLISFTATNQNNGVQLSWKTANEQITSHFEIEKSEDGVDFKTIGSVKAVGNSAANGSYTYFDAQVSPSVIYYRLKIVEEGKEKYSPIITVKTNTTGKLEIYPNPVNNVLHLQFGSTNAKQLQIADVKGSIVKTVSLNQTGLVAMTIDVSDLKAGTYFVQAGLQTIVFVKQ